MILQHNQSFDPDSPADVIREPTLQLINQLTGIQLEQYSEQRTLDGPAVRFPLTGDIRTTFSIPEVTGSKQNCSNCFSSMVSFVLYSVDGAMEIALYLRQD